MGKTEFQRDFEQAVAEQFAKLFKVRNNDEDDKLEKILEELKEINDILKDICDLIDKKEH